jgi:hypothetical protein
LPFVSDIDVISVPIYILQCDIFGDDWRCLLSHRNFLSNLENTVSILFFEDESSALSKTVKYSVLENSNVSSLTNHLNIASMKGSLVPQLKKRCKGVSIKTSGIPAKSQKVQFGEWFLTKCATNMYEWAPGKKRISFLS